MNLIRRLLHHLLGPTRYHDQANEVQTRRMRVERLSRELDLYRRGQ